MAAILSVRVRSGYAPSMMQVHPPALEDIFPLSPLYKFLPLSEHQQPPWRERVSQLLAGRAYFPSPSDFNDPFDCVPHIELPSTEEEFEAAKRTMIERVARTPGVQKAGFSFDQAVSLMEGGLRGKTVEEVSNALQISAARTSNRLGVFCLAECIGSVLMWSHYASNHTGLALRFELKNRLRGGLNPLFKVRYSEQRPRIFSFMTEVNPDDVADAMKSKAKFWEYEQEWRGLLPDGARTVVDFDPVVITGLIFGAKCPPDARSWVVEQMAGRLCEFLHVVPTHDTFDLRIETFPA